MTYHTELKITDLVGAHVNNATINDRNDLIVLETDKGKYFLTFEGDCCATCFLAHINGVENLINSTIGEIRESEWKTLKNEHDYEVIESMGVTIVTNSGYVDMETRLEHNGYYGGYLLLSKEGPLDQYNQIRDTDKKEVMRKLEDF